MRPGVRGNPACSGSYSAVESNILVFFHPDLKSTYCFYAHMHEIMKLNRSKSVCRIHWEDLYICSGPCTKFTYSCSARQNPYEIFQSSLGLRLTAEFLARCRPRHKINMILLASNMILPVGRHLEISENRLKRLIRILARTA